MSSAALLNDASREVAGGLLEEPAIVEQRQGFFAAPVERQVAQHDGGGFS